MKIYLAGSSGELELCASYMSRLREAGHEITVDWPANIRAVGDANPRDASHEDRLRWTMEDIEGVNAADIFWLLMPEKPSIGCWVELGMACSRPKVARVVVSGDWRRAIFTALADERYDSHEQAFEALRRIAELEGM